MRGGLASFGLAALAAGILVAGCGGQDQSGAQTDLLVTRDFGATSVVAESAVPATAGLTAMRQLQTRSKVETSYGGRFVNSINGLKGGGGEDWLFYVDGVHADKAATEVRLSGGETVQWDFHPWQAVELSGAIVGAYPEPLLARGVDPSCADGAEEACDRVRQALDSDGVDLDMPKDDSVTVEVGTWEEVAGVKGVPDLSKEPIESGVFATFAGSTGVLILADANGALVEKVGPGAGLVFAYRDGTDVNWVVTGTTPAGVAAAAELLDRDTLRGRFAVATVDGRTIPLPVRGGGGG